MKELKHATAIVVGDSGVILIGPSGVGKTQIALQLVATARREGYFAAFVSDDQVFIELRDADLIASGPETIRGLVELRGSGLGRVDWVSEARLDFVLQPVILDSHNRIPEENRTFELISGHSLPLFSINAACPDPFFWLCCLVPNFPISDRNKLPLRDKVQL